MKRMKAASVLKIQHIAFNQEHHSLTKQDATDRLKPGFNNRHLQLATHTAARQNSQATGLFLLSTHLVVYESVKMCR